MYQDPDRDFLLDGITNSFKIIPGNVQLTDADVTNYCSAMDSRVWPQVERQLLNEIKQGNYIIAAEKPPIVSALGAIPKQDSNDIRLIHDCSRPDSPSLNSYVDSKHYSYETVDKITANIKQGAFMAKVDLKSVYHHVPLHPSNY